MAKVATVGGVTGVGFLALGLGLPRVIDDLSPYVSYGMAGIGLILLIGCYLWTLFGQGEDDTFGLRQKTTGSHSPTIKADGNVTINYGSAPTVAPEEAQTSPWDDPNFRLSDPRTWQVHGQEPIPDLELREVCERLYDRLGGPAQLIADFEKRVDLEIRDAVKFQKLHTWGRKKPGEGLDNVWKDGWLRGDFSHKRGSLIFRHPDNPNSPITWTDIRFNRREVDKWLPPKPKYEMIIV